MKKWLTLLGLSALTLTSAYASTTTLEKNLKKEFPQVPTKILGDTPIKGVYELLVGDTIVYTDENARYFFVGNLVDFKNKQNLTAKREEALTKIDVNTLPLEQAIKHVKGDGSRTLYVFSDPDCPYCKKLEKNMTSVDNVTLYTFLFPLKNLHPNAETVAQQIWCASNPYEAWEDYMILNKAPTTTANCDNPIQKNIALGRSLNITGTPTLFLADGSRISGALDAEDLNKLLDQYKK